MKRLIRIILFTAVALLGIAQQPPSKTDSVIPLDMRARWWRAVAEQAEAQAAAQQKATVSQSIVEEMTKFCGDRTLIRNAKGEPDCAAAEKPAEKKP